MIKKFWESILQTLSGAVINFSLNPMGYCVLKSNLNFPFTIFYTKPPTNTKNCHTFANPKAFGEMVTKLKFFVRKFLWILSSAVRGFKVHLGTSFHLLNSIRYLLKQLSTTFVTDS